MKKLKSLFVYKEGSWIAVNKTISNVHSVGIYPPKNYFFFGITCPIPAGVNSGDGLILHYKDVIKENKNNVINDFPFTVTISSVTDDTSGTIAENFWSVEGIDMPTGFEEDVQERCNIDSGHITMHFILQYSGDECPYEESDSAYALYWINKR